MKTQKFYTNSFVSSLWIFVLFNMTFRDFHQFLSDGYIEEMMNANIPESNMLFYAFILEIPIAMTILSRVLEPQYNKWFNIILASVVALGMLISLVSADLDDIFFTSMELFALVFIVHISWRLPSKEIAADHG